MIVLMVVLMAYTVNTGRQFGVPVDENFHRAMQSILAMIR